MRTIPPPGSSIATSTSPSSGKQRPLGFDTFMIEGFQFAGVGRSLDKVRWKTGYPFEVLSWSGADCRYLMGLFNAG